MLNWASLNNTYCQTVYKPVEMFISAFLHSCMKQLNANFSGMLDSDWSVRAFCCQMTIDLIHLPLSQETFTHLI